MRYVVHSMMCLLLVSISGGFPFSCQAADLRNLQERLDQILIEEIYRVADQGKILSNEEFGVGASLEEIQQPWGQEDDGNPTLFRSKGVGFGVQQGIVSMVYPTTRNFYSLSRDKFLDVLGSPVDMRSSGDGWVQLFRYRTKLNRHHLICIFRKLDSDTYNQMDYFVLRTTAEESEVVEAMDYAMKYGSFGLKLDCTIL